MPHTGVGIYTYYLVKNLLAVDKENRYCLFFFNRFKQEGNDLLCSSIAPYQLEESDYATTLNALRILWEQIVLPSRVNSQKVDVFHYIDHTLSLLRKPCPTVITVHDLAFFRVPEMYNLSRRFYKQFISQRSVRRADRIITISEYTRREILELTGIDSRKVEVIPYGVDEKFRHMQNDPSLEEFRKKAGLPKRFILFVGTLQPRKNIDGLLNALHKVYRMADLDHKLVICGDRGWLYNEVFDMIRRLGLSDKVHYMDCVPHDHLPYIYNLADLFVYPSWFEGFGLPPLEAMACGTPVITSNATSIPEVVGDAGLTVHPADIDGLAQAICDVLTKPELASRMREDGLKRAMKFSWAENARRTIDVYQRTAVES